jgi:hypothetical protein
MTHVPMVGRRSTLADRCLIGWKSPATRSVEPAMAEGV